MFKDLIFSQKCVLIKTDAPFGPLDSIWACQRANNMCRSVRCQHQKGFINRGEITKSLRIKKQFSIDDVVDVEWFPEVYCDWAPWSWDIDGADLVLLLQ